MALFLLIFNVLSCLSVAINATVWKFGQDSWDSSVIANLKGGLTILEKEKEVSIPVPRCMSVNYVQVYIYNPLSTPAISLNTDTNTVTISYKLLQYSRSTYDIIAKGKVISGCYAGSGICALSTSNRPDDLIPESCFVDDMSCWKRSMHTYIVKTHTGIPKYEIRPIDPLPIPSLKYDGADLDIDVMFRNVIVTGLKNQYLSKLIIDEKQRNVLLQSKVDSLKINAEIEIYFKKLSKSYLGTYSAAANATGTIRYPYDERLDDTGEVYFGIGSETVTCASEEESMLQYNKETATNILSDPYVKSTIEKILNAGSCSRRKNLVCQIVEAAYKDVVHNLKVATKLFPKSAFMKTIA